MSITEDEFRSMCQRHDLTFDYSDDGQVWRRGCASRDAIKLAAKDLEPGAAARIWNEVVDTKLLPDYRQQFYWKG